MDLFQVIIQFRINIHIPLDAVNGLLRLTVNGTSYYGNLRERRQSFETP